MVTGNFKCPLCKKLQSCKNESKLKVIHDFYLNDNDIFTTREIQHICMNCYNVILKIENLNEVKQ